MSSKLTFLNFYLFSFTEKLKFSYFVFFLVILIQYVLGCLDHKNLRYLLSDVCGFQGTMAGIHLSFQTVSSLVFSAA